MPSSVFYSYPAAITVADFNGDNQLDAAVINAQTDDIGVLFSHGDGTFSLPIVLHTGSQTFSTSMAVSDFNEDNHLDIVVVNFLVRNIGLFLGCGNETFELERTFFTGGKLYPAYVTVGDLNGDAKQDIVFSYNAPKIGIMLGNGDGTFRPIRKFNTTSDWTGSAVAIADFNRDGHFDIVVGQTYPYSVCLLLADGNGNFEARTIFSTELRGLVTAIVVGDFNGDNYPDIVAIDTNSGSMDMLLNTGVCNGTEMMETSTNVHG